VVQLVLAELPQVDPEDERFEAKMTVLEELVQHHVEEEEKEMFKSAEKLGRERLEELGDELESRAEGASGDEDEEGAEDYEEDEGEEAEEDEEEEEEEQARARSARQGRRHAPMSTRPRR
jgi:hypothetical protein